PGALSSCAAAGRVWVVRFAKWRMPWVSPISIKTGQPWSDRVVVGKPGDEVANSGPREQLDIAARLFAAEADVALANHADVAQQPIVQLGQRVGLPAPPDPPAQPAPRLPECHPERDAEQRGTRRCRTELVRPKIPDVGYPDNLAMRGVHLQYIDVSQQEFKMKHMYHIMRNSTAGARNDALPQGTERLICRAYRTGHGFCPLYRSMKNVTEL